MKRKDKIVRPKNLSALPKMKKRGGRFSAGASGRPDKATARLQRKRFTHRFDNDRSRPTQIETIVKFFHQCSPEELRNLAKITPEDVEEARNIWLQECICPELKEPDTGKKNKKKGKGWISRLGWGGFKKEDIVNPCANAFDKVMASDPEESKIEPTVTVPGVNESTKIRRHSLDDLPRASSVRTWSKNDEDSSSPTPRKNRRSWPKEILSAGVLEPLGLDATVSSVSGSSSEVDPAENKKLSRRKVKVILGISTNDSVPQLFEVSPHWQDEKLEELHYNDKAADPINDLVRQAERRAMSTDQLQALAHDMLMLDAPEVHVMLIQQHRDLLENADEVGFCIFWSQRMESFLSELIKATETYAGKLAEIVDSERAQFTKHRKPKEFYDAVGAVVAHLQNMETEMGVTRLLSQLKVSREVEKTYNKFQKFATMMEDLENASQCILRRCNRLTARVFKIIDPKSKEKHDKSKKFGAYTTIPYSEEHIKRVLREPQRQELKKWEKVYLCFIEYYNIQRSKFYRKDLPKWRGKMKIQAENMERRIKLHNYLSAKVLQSFVEFSGLKGYKVDKMEYKKRAVEEIGNFDRSGTSRKGAVYYQGRLLKQPSVIDLSEGGFPLLTNRLVCDPESIHEQLDRLKNADFRHTREAYQASQARRMTSPGASTPPSLIGATKSVPAGKPIPIKRAKSRQIITKEQTTMAIPRKNPQLGDILSDKKLLTLMAKYMEQTRNLENLEFLLAVDDFFIDPREDLEWEREQAMDIYKTFVEINSPKWVNLKDGNRKTIEVLAEVSFQGPKTKNIDLRTTFEDAYYEVAELVENGIVMKFIQSPMYKQFIEKQNESSSDEEKDEKNNMHGVALLIGQAFPEQRRTSLSPRKKPLRRTPSR